MTQQGITETRMHSDSNLDSHYHKKMNIILRESLLKCSYFYRMDVTCSDSYCSYFIYY